MANSTAISNIVGNVSVSWLAGGSMSVSGTTLTISSITTVAYGGVAMTGVNSVTAASGQSLILSPGAGAGHLYVGLGPVLADAAVSPTTATGGFGYIFRTTGMENVFGIQNLSVTNETYTALTAFNQNGQEKFTFGYGNLSSIIWKNRAYFEAWEGQGGAGADTIVPDIIFVQTAVTGAPGYYGRILMKGNALGGAPGDIDFLKATAWGSDVEPPAARMFTIFADGSGVESVATIKAPSITNNAAGNFVISSSVAASDVLTIKSTSTTGFSSIDFVSSASNTTQMAFGFGNSGTSAPFTSANYLYLNASLTVWNGGSIGVINATTGTWSFPANIASTSTTTGTQIVTGGIGVSGAGWFGGTLHSNGLSAITAGTSLTLTSSTSGGIIVSNIDGGQFRINHSNTGTSPNILFQENGSAKGSIGTSTGDMYLVTSTVKSIIFNPGNGTTALTLAPTTLTATFGGNIVSVQGQGWGVTSVATASGTTTLTSASTAVQIFTGILTQTVQLPAANLFGAGVAVVYVIKNRSTNNVTVQRASSDTIDGQTSYAIGSMSALTLMSDGSSAWEII